MSWGALPYWAYEVAYERELAEMSCAFESEWFSGTSRVLPDHVINLMPATMATWNPGGWNHHKGQG